MKGGFGRIGANPKKMKQMMRQMGISVNELSDVEEVTIKTANANIIFRDAVVTVMEMQGSKMYQIIGTPEEHSREQDEAESNYLSKEDIELVMEKAGCTEEEAKSTLKETKGDLVEAITKLACE